MDCLDCKFCRPIVKRQNGELITAHMECKKGHWQTADGLPKTLKLAQCEVTTGHYTWRDLFTMGERCIDMYDMTTEE